MTKVIIHRDVLDYQRQIATDINEIRKEYSIAGLPQGNSVPPELRDHISIGGLLQPPKFEILIPVLNERIDESLILASIYSHDLDIWSVYVTIKTEQGELIESGDAEEDGCEPGLWEYMPTISIPASTTVIVQVFAIDRLNAVGTLSEVTVVG